MLIAKTYETAPLSNEKAGKSFPATN